MPERRRREIHERVVRFEQSDRCVIVDRGKVAPDRVVASVFVQGYVHGALWPQRETGDRRNIFLTSNDRCSNSATVSGKMIRNRPVCPHVFPCFRRLSAARPPDTRVAVVSILPAKDMKPVLM